jgi:hypothetical protein
MGPTAQVVSCTNSRFTPATLVTQRVARVVDPDDRLDAGHELAARRELGPGVVATLCPYVDVDELLDLAHRKLHRSR